MAITINAQVTGYGPQPGNTQALVRSASKLSLGRRSSRDGSLSSAGV
jgi:hypothetical protein